MTRKEPRKVRPIPIAPPNLVQSRTDYAQFLRHVSGQPWLALDTESDSLFRYAPKVCLIQITAPADPAEKFSLSSPTNVVDYLIDPLQLRKLSELGEILADDSTDIILHAAENDILTLQRDLGFRLRRIYDTQLAARILGKQGVGLANVLYEEFGVVSDKRMQRTNWGKRPLTPQQLTYAQIDTHYLPALRARQMSKLEETKRFEEARAAFRMLETTEYRPPEPRTVWQIKKIRSVDEKDLGVLKAIWEWREEFSRQTDRPPFKVLGENSMILLSQKRPKSLHLLREIPGLGARQVTWFGKELLEAIQRGKRLPTPQRPAPVRKIEPLLTRSAKKRFESLRQWRTKTAESRGVDPDIVFSNETLLQIATCQPTSLAELEKVPSVGRWKAQNYGTSIFSLLGDGNTN